MDLKSAENYAAMIRAVEGAVEAYVPSKRPEQASARARFDRLWNLFDSLLDSDEQGSNIVNAYGRTPNATEVEIVLTRKVYGGGSKLQIEPSFKNLSAQITVHGTKLPAEEVNDYYNNFPPYKNNEYARQLGSMEETFEAAATLLGVDLNQAIELNV